MKVRSIFLSIALLVIALPGLAQDKATKQLTLTVNPATVTISPATIPNGMVGLSYTTTITASGGISPYVFSVPTGTLPAGLTLGSSSGVLSGTPTTAGSSTFTVQVADSETSPATATQSYTVTVVPTFAITTTNLSAANIGVSYTGTLTATGGVAPYTWAVTTGSLPAGLTLNSATGVISGTPTSAGSVTFTVTATDSATNVVKLQIKTKIEVASLTKKDNRS